MKSVAKTLPHDSQKKEEGKSNHSWPMALTRILFIPQFLPLVILDTLLAWNLFAYGVTFSRFFQSSQIWQEEINLITAVFTLIFILSNIGLDLYNRLTRFNWKHISVSIVISTIFAITGTITFIYLTMYTDISTGRLTLIYGGLVTIAGAFMARIGIVLILSRYPYRFTIFANNTHLEEINKTLPQKVPRLSFFMYVPWDEIFPEGDPPTLDKLVEAQIGDVVLTNQVLDDPDSVDFAISAVSRNFNVIDQIEFFDSSYKSLPIDQLSRSWVIQRGITKRRSFQMFIKRSLDILLSSIGIIVLSPLLIGITLAIRLTSKGNAIFIQQRQGQYFETFPMYKFRTMYEKDCSKDGSSNFTSKNDSRVTPIGRLLRPLHLDELPQLFNILLGHMSIVGPRPEAEQFAKKMRQLINIYELRYLMRPGLTGHAQINQGYAMNTVEDTKKKLSFDLYYLCRYSLWFDLEIIIKTVFFLAKNSR